MGDKGRPLPKFGEWDVNDPSSAEGFTVIFNKARNEKKTGVRLSRQGEMTPHTSKRLFLESLNLRKNGFAVYKLLMQINEVALTVLRASKRALTLSNDPEDRSRIRSYDRSYWNLFVCYFELW